MSSALASLKRLSPSRITSNRCGGRSCLRTVVAAAASGGATMAPSAIAAAHGMSGTSSRVTTATMAIVRTTAPRARLVTARQFARRSRGEESKAASTRTGATNSASASSGSSTIVGTPGISASAAPASATSAGYGAPIRRARAARAAPTSSSAMTTSNTLIASSGLPSHLDHRSPEPRASEKALRGLVPIRGREHDPGRAFRLEGLQCRVEQPLADALPAMGGIDHDVMQHAGRPAQRHVIVPLDSRVRIAHHLAVALGGKDDDVRLLELRPEKRAVSVLRPRRRGDEAVRVEVVVRTDEERAEPPNGFEVRGRRGANENGRQAHFSVLQRSIVRCAPSEYRAPCTVI